MSNEPRPHAPSPAPASLTADSIRESVQQTVGFLPNAVAEMLISPPVTALVLTGKKLLAGASLTAREQHAIELFIAVRSDCNYCRTWHVGLGLRAGLQVDQVQLIVSGQPPTDPWLRQLLSATELVMSQGGHLAPDEIARLAAAGVDRKRLFEIIALVGLNLITNAINTVAQTPPDDRFVGALEKARVGS